MFLSFIYLLFCLFLSFFFDLIISKSFFCQERKSNEETSKAINKIQNSFEQLERADRETLRYVLIRLAEAVHRLVKRFETPFFLLLFFFCSILFRFLIFSFLLFISFSFLLFRFLIVNVNKRDGHQPAPELLPPTPLNVLKNVPMDNLLANYLLNRWMSHNKI